MRLETGLASLAGRRQLLPLPARVWPVLVGLLALAQLLPALASNALAVEYAQQITNRLNPTGRTLTFQVPLKDNGQLLGEVLIEITADDAVFIDKVSIQERVAPLLNEEARAALTALAASNGAFVPVTAFPPAGFALNFDSGLQELVLELTPEQRPSSDLALGGRYSRMISSNLTQPEFFAGYVNVFAGASRFWNEASKGSVFDDQSGFRLELESAVRVGGIVIDNRFAFEDGADIYECPPTAICSYGHAGGFKRQNSRLIYDIAGEDIRIMLGDTDPLATPLQRAADILGLSIEKSARKLNPGESIISTGSGSFRLDRNAMVEVFVNGASVQTLKLRPGNYTLRDLHLATGANNIELVIVDENGQRQSLTFSSYADTELLAAGKNEWAIAAGLPSFLLDNERTYARDALMASGFARYGLTDEITAEADLQADLDIVMGGGGIDFGTAWGVFGLHVAASTGGSGTGVAADLDWRLVNFKGLSGTSEENLVASAEYRSADFHTPGEFLSSADGILFPEYDYWLRLEGSYSLPVYEDVMATLSVRYQFDDEDRNPISTYRVKGDRYGADVTLSAPLSDIANASLTIGYSNEVLIRDLEDRAPIDPEFRIGLRFNVRPDDTTTVTSGYDTLGDQATLSARKSEGNGIGRWDTNVDVDNRGYENSATVSASAGYYGNRAELRLSHYADADDFRFSDAIEGFSRQRTSVRVGSAIAFAGDRIAIGAPVRGGAFAILAPHETLANNDITAGSPEEPRAKADVWGNGLITDLPAYLPASTTIDVADLPLGYSLGSGAFDTYAPYKAGYVFAVGSQNSVTAYGTLLTSNGEPVPLLTGTARLQGKDAAPVSVFTNSEGRFGAEGLSPGRWIVEMAANDSVMLYAIDVPDGANGLVKTGNIKPFEERAR